MFADFLTVIPQTHSMVVITYRPEYRGALAHVPGAQTLSLAPLSDSETTALLDELLGSDPSVAGVKALIAGRARRQPVLRRRRSCANSPNAVYSKVSAVPTFAVRTWPM